MFPSLAAAALPAERGGPAELNRDSLRSIMKYVSSLRKHGEIDEKAFTDLVLQACSIYIENEVDRRVSEALNKHFKLVLLHDAL